MPSRQTSAILEGLSDADVRQFNEEGYCVLEDVVSRADLEAALRSLSQELTPTTTDRTDRYNKEGRVDFRKIPNLARKNESFRVLACNTSIVSAVEALLTQRPLLFRDVMVVKPAHDGAHLDFHQDSEYWDIEPRSLISAWFTFRDVGPENGCLQVIPGSHMKQYDHDILIADGYPLPSAITGALRKMASLAGTGDSDASGFSVARRLKNNLLGQLSRHASFLAKLQDLHARVPNEEKKRAVNLSVRSGSVVLFHSMLLHASNPNTSAFDRPAYIASYMGDQFTFCGVGEPEFLVVGEPMKPRFQKINAAKP
jgi:ectoine hydroxylase-related dioxygenase (phytanoyl-CoA dioxygenase family)